MQICCKKKSRAFIMLYKNKTFKYQFSEIHVLRIINKTLFGLSKDQFITLALSLLASFLQFHQML